MPHLVITSLLTLGLTFGLTGVTGLAARDGLPAGTDATPRDADAATVVHVLNRVAFGPRPGDVERVRAMGLSNYIDQQLHPERIDDSVVEARLEDFETLNMSTGELAERYFLPALRMRREAALKQQSGANTDNGNGAQNVSPEARMAQAAQQQVITELMQARMLRATLSDRQLQEVLTDFWFNHFNVFVGKGQVRQYLTAYERDVIRPNVLGDFRTLLGAVAHSPAMLLYLDNFQNVAPNASLLSRPAPSVSSNAPDTIDARRRLMQRLQQERAQQARPTRGLNENYAREIMELHTLGVDAGYTQQDVVALARIFTGWTIDRPQQGGQFVFRPQLHDNGPKTFLGVSFAATGEREGEQALDMLARHPATARHIAYQLAQRFVADEPPAALVDRAAAVFLKTKGNLRDVVRSIITSPEFFAASTVRAKVKTPLEFVVSAARATNADISSAQPLVTALRNLGMPLYGCQPPTGYSMTSGAWVNTGALLGRMNFAVQLVAGGRMTPTAQAGRNGQAAGDSADNDQSARRSAAPARRPALVRGPVAIDVAALTSGTDEASRRHVIEVMLNGNASAATEQTLAGAATPQNLVALALGSPEFQRR